MANIVTNSTCPVCSRPSVEDHDDDGTGYNHCVSRDGCLCVYVTPPGRPGPTVRQQLWEDQADHDAWAAEQWASAGA